MFKILVVMRHTMTTGCSVHSNVIDFDNELSADKALEKLDQQMGSSRSSITEVVKLY